MDNKNNKSKKINNELDIRLIIVILIAVIFMVCITVLLPNTAHNVIITVFHFVCYNLGFSFLIGAIGCFIFLIWFAFSKYGKIKLGGKNAQPDFSFSTYAFMMFTAGVGSSLIYWAIGEPIIYLQNPPMYAEKGSLEATIWAIAYPLFHWGPVGWAIYAIPSIPFAYTMYVKKSSEYKASALCSGIIGSKKANGFTGTIIDILSVLGILCAITTSTGFCVDLITTVLSATLKINNAVVMQIAIILSITLLFTLTCVSGIKKGISRISDWCIYLAIAFGLFVFIFTNPGFITDYYFDSSGFMFQNIVRMSTWLDPVGKSGFPQNWTIYYWSWYFSFFIMMGMFLAKISRGRTFKELILTCIICGSLGCSFFIGIFGGYSVYSEISGNIPVALISSEHGISMAVFELVSSLPMGEIVVIVFLLVQYFLLVTTITSAVYALSSISSKNLPIEKEPNTFVKIIWAFIVSGMCMTVFFMGGDMEIIKSMCVITGFPMLIVTVLSLLSTMKDLKK